MKTSPNLIGIKSPFLKSCSRKSVLLGETWPYTSLPTNSGSWLTKLPNLILQIPRSCEGDTLSSDIVFKSLQRDSPQGRLINRNRGK